MKAILLTVLTVIGAIVVLKSVLRIFGVILVLTSAAVLMKVSTPNQIRAWIDNLNTERDSVILEGEVG